MEKNICLFLKGERWAGGETFFYKAALALDRRGYNVISIVKENGDLYKRLMKANVKVYTVGFEKRDKYNLFNYIKIYKILKKNNIDTIIFNNENELFLGGAVSKLLKMEKIVFRRGKDTPLKKNIKYRLLYKYIVTDFIANSKSVRESLIRRKEIEGKKIHLVHNGINVEEYKKQSFEKIIKRENNEIILGNLGRVDFQKGQQYLVELAEELVKRNIDFKIYIAGKGKREKKLKNLVERKSLEDKVVFIGFVENVKNFLESIDIFVFTSLWEGFPNSLVENLAARNPVVAFEINSIREVLINNYNGYMVDFGDINEMADKIEYLYNDRSKVNELGENAYKLLEEKFTEDKVFNDLEKAIKLSDGV